MASFSHVQSLGRQLPANPDMPLAADIAVIMYTSGSTGLPKVKSMFLSVIVIQQMGGVTHLLHVVKSFS